MTPPPSPGQGALLSGQPLTICHPPCPFRRQLSFNLSRRNARGVRGGVVNFSPHEASWGQHRHNPQAPFPKQRREINVSTATTISLWPGRDRHFIQDARWLHSSPKCSALDWATTMTPTLCWLETETGDSDGDGATETGGWTGTGPVSSALRHRSAKQSSPSPSP